MEVRSKSKQVRFQSAAFRFRFAKVGPREIVDELLILAVAPPAVVAGAVLASALHLVGPDRLIARVAIW